MPGRVRTQHQPKAREGEEIWETTTAGTIWAMVTDDRGKEKSVSVGGAVGQRLRIKSLDREIGQDRVLDDASDPFVNGLLKRVDADQNLDERTQSEQVLSTEELMAIFDSTGNAFQSKVRKLNELNVRRLRDAAETLDAKASQLAFLDEHIAENYKGGGDTVTYREMQADRDVAP
jgi:hypothetical protein